MRTNTLENNVARKRKPIHVRVIFFLFFMEEVLRTPPILVPSPKRLVLLPIEHPEIWDMYKDAQASFWTAEEIDFAHDLHDYHNVLTPKERTFINHVLAFFAASDGIIIENLATRFMREVQWPEARAFYGFQIAMENVHSETYGRMIEIYLAHDPQEKARLFNAVQTMECVARKAAWALRYIEDELLTFAQRLCAFAVVEGVFFSASFCAIYWLKKRNLMPGLAISNELISRDEGLHTDFACLLFACGACPLPERAWIEEMMRDAVEVEARFVEEALREDLLGINATRMMEYVRFVTQRLYVELVGTACAPLFTDKNPFEWMELISLEGKGNFFERRVTEYARGAITSSREGPPEASHTFTTDADF